MDKKILLVAVFGTLFLIVQFFILIPWYEKDKVVDIFYQGYDEGLKYAIVSMYNETENCNTVPIFVNNQSKNLIESSCIIFDNTP